MSTHDPLRQPAGTPSGGQFAPDPAGQSAAPVELAVGCPGGIVLDVETGEFSRVPHEPDPSIAEYAEGVDRWGLRPAVDSYVRAGLNPRVVDTGGGTLAVIVQRGNKTWVTASGDEDMSGVMQIDSAKWTSADYDGWADADWFVDLRDEHLDDITVVMSGDIDEKAPAGPWEKIEVEGRGQHYIVIERQYGPDLAVLYRSEGRAGEQLESALIDGLCEEDCLDAYVQRNAPAGADVIIPDEEHR